MSKLPVYFVVTPPPGYSTMDELWYEDQARMNEQVLTIIDSLQDGDSVTIRIEREKPEELHDV